jgi:ureidoacrylate peracid hydrolase
METAVLIIDLQNGFCSPGGSVAGALGIDADSMRAVISQTSELISSARVVGMPIFFTRHVSRDKMRDATRRMRAAALPGTTPLLRGSWDAAIIEPLGVRDEDVVVDKNRYDAFLYTDLDAILRGEELTRLLVAGVVTNLCVESSVRSAEQRGYDVYVAADACAGPPPFHEASLAALDGPFATVGPWRSLLDELVDSCHSTAVVS